ncbi:MAG: hypothetical protein NQ127_04120 [Candidatus Cardinium sp.]|nr:hypothetical protein [Candidatus Cardinium sp.]
MQPVPTVSAVAAGHSAIVLFALSVEATVRADHLFLVMKANLILLSFVSGSGFSTSFLFASTSISSSISSFFSAAATFCFSSYAL